jgi:MoaA/NifB/PqqE/SkfB family radical SAM enzyme
MKFINKIKSLGSIIKIKIFKKRIPLAVRWQLTNRCPNRCIYCKIWADDYSNELSTTKILTIIDSLKKHGTQTISFSGGEPLLRKDIGTILDYCQKKNISTSMNSNGALLPQKINQIQTLDLLKLSFDGPEEIHDRIANCKGSYHQVFRAIEIAQARGIKTIFTTTLTKYNIAHLSFILEMAKRYNTLVAFQPLKRLSKGVEHLEDMMPQERKYKQAIAELIALKKKGDKSMRNSLYELEHIYQWPRYKNLECWAGRIFCMIGTQGELYPCDRIQYKTEMPNCVTLGFKKAFESLPRTINCDGCGFCGTLELNFLLSFKLGIIRTIRKIVD